MAATAHELALRYLLELSADIRGAMLMESTGEVLAATGRVPGDALAETGRRVAREVVALRPAGEGPVEVDVLVERGALFVLGESAQVMVCTTSRSVNPGLIFYDMHAVLRDIRRAAAAEARRAPAGSEA